MAVGSLKFREIDLGKKLGFERCEAKLWPMQLFHSIQCVIDNVNFYHYPSYISLAKSSLPKFLTYLILNFTLLL